MRINSVNTTFTNVRPAAAKPLAGPSVDSATTPRTTADAGRTHTTAAAAPASKAKAHGVIRKLGAGHYSHAVDAKLTARFAPERLAPSAPDSVIDPATDPALDPALDPQISPDNQSTDPGLTTATGLGDEASTREALLTRTTTSAFANFNLLDFATSSSIDLIA